MVMEVHRLVVDESESLRIEASKYIQVLKRDFKEKAKIRRDTVSIWNRIGCWRLNWMGQGGI